jgi:excisionase family DNA binding protein
LPDYVTTEEAAEILGYHVQYVRKMARTGKLLADKKAGVWLIHRDALSEYQDAIAGMAKHDPWKPGGRQRETEKGFRSE